MATSNSTDWSLNRDQLITTSLRKLGVLPSGGTPSASQISEATDSLQALIKAYQADGMPLWKISSQAFTVVSGTSSYTVGPSQTINCPKPVRIIQARSTVFGGTNSPMTVYNRYDFNDLPQGATYTGTPINFYYQPLRTTGVIKIWPSPNESTTSITFDYTSPYEDMDASANDFDFPSEWMIVLIYALAWSLAPEYGIPIQDRQTLKNESDFWHNYVLSLGSEEGSIYLRPDRE